MQSYYTDKEQPEWVRDAKSRQLVEHLAIWARETLPADLLDGRDAVAVSAPPASAPEPRAASVGSDGEYETE